jgi:biofilm PGA synthesis lipoprotein PgaB
MGYKIKRDQILVWGGLFLLLAALSLINYPKIRSFYEARKDLIVSSSTTEAPKYPIYYRDKVAILMYHNFDNNETSATISGDHFREHMEMLQAKGYNFISLSQLGEFMAGKTEIPPNAVIITIDDGYASIYRWAYPVMLEKNIPASIFMIVKNIGASKNQIPKLNWEQMQEMKNHGIDFYSHTYDSHHLVRRQDGSEGPALITHKFIPEQKRNETDAEYASRIRSDLLLSKSILEKGLGTAVDFLALPYGYDNDLVRQIAQAVGFKYLLTVNPGLVDRNSDPMALKRINAGQAGMDAAALHYTISNLAQQ